MMEPNKELDSEKTRGGMVELRFRIPLSLALWLDKKAQEFFGIEHRRNRYVNHLLMEAKRSENGRQ